VKLGEGKRSFPSFLAPASQEPVKLSGEPSGLGKVLPESADHCRVAGRDPAVSRSQRNAFRADIPKQRPFTGQVLRLAHEYADNDDFELKAEVADGDFRAHGFLVIVHRLLQHHQDIDVRPRGRVTAGLGAVQDHTDQALTVKRFEAPPEFREILADLIVHENYCSVAKQRSRGPPCPAPGMKAYYAVRIRSDLSPEMAACAAASRAIGTRYSEHDT